MKRKYHHRALFLAISALTTTVGSHFAEAATATWQGGSDGNWNEAANWIGSVPGHQNTAANQAGTNADTAYFLSTGSTTINVDSYRNIEYLIFDNAQAFTFQGGPLQVTNAGYIELNADVQNAQVFNAPLALPVPGGAANAPGFTLFNYSNNPNASLTFNSTVTGQNKTGNTGNTTIRLNGTNTGLEGTFAGAISDGGGATNVGFIINDYGTWAFNGANTYSGGTSVRAGTVQLTQNSGTPLGTGSLNFNNGTISIAPTGTTGVASVSLAGKGSFTVANGNLDLNKGTASSLVVSFGQTPVRAASNSGAIIVQPSAIGNLGTTEQVLINNGASLQANGIVNPTYLAQDVNNGKAGDFLVYGANGLQTATSAGSVYTLNSVTPIGTVNSNTAVFDADSGPADVTGTTQVYALKDDGLNITGEPGATLIVGSGTTTSGIAQAGVILNGGTISVPTLSFGPDEAVIYTSSQNATISSLITGTGTFTTVGPGTLKLTNTANQLPPVVSINGGLLSVDSPGELGGAGTIVINAGGLQATNSFTLSQNISTPANSGAADIDVTANNTLTVAGTIAPVVSASNYPLYKTGAGTLVLSGANTYGAYNNIQGTVVYGGTLIAANTTVGQSSTGTGPVVLNGGTLGSAAGGATSYISNSVVSNIGTNRISPGGDGALGVLEIGTALTSGSIGLTTTANTTLSFDLGPSASDASYTGDELIVSSGVNVSIAQGTLISISSFGGGSIATGSYPLINSFSLAANANLNNLFTLPAPPQGLAFQLVGNSSDGWVDLDVTAATPEPATLGSVMAAMMMLMRRRRKSRCL